MVLEAGKSKIKMPTHLMSGEDTLLGLLLVIFSLYLHMADSREVKQALSCLFIKAFILFIEGSTLKT